MITEFDCDIFDFPLNIKIINYTPIIYHGFFEENEDETIEIEVYVMFNNSEIKLQNEIYCYLEDELIDFSLENIKEYYKNLKFEKEIELLDVR